ncbi:MAG: mechanosensitive ion channel [Symploca sp. SIO1C4]|uniref:Mechanosensitive ion channel n=1 Tax=Symploca sp. SIO1C4 TaxID=2607765 RepID=A0A6B3N3B8_9CYAN|nr:mechanosensitive ion channel [Symploca sp. SIO1C4]NET08028.1 mechanosensitive ion channel [Symploca sp. SIO2B6]
MDLVLQKFFMPLFEIFTTKVSIGGNYISLYDVVKLIFWLLIVVLLSGALRNFLKQRLLVRLRIDQANREVIATIISYSTGTFGFLVVLQGIGIDLASLAVIAGGLGIGIGFGLQDITKNFVSGLTLLFERTIKVGDFVEFDGLSGYVKAISLRSTVIRTREGGDVFVPNSILSENRILNWSYDSYIARIHLPVGVAYSSDPVLVTETLLKSAYMEPAVLHDPSPLVLFRGFGDNSLDFELRVWVNRIDKEPDLRSSLNFIIEYNLRQHGITIPFPQRDLWIKNPETLNLLTRPRKEAQNPPPSAPPLQPPQLPTQSSKPLSVRSLLRLVTYFENLSDLEVRQLIEIGYRKRLVPSQVLFHEDEPGDAFYIILSGSVEVFVAKLSKHLTILGAGQFFGELALMLGIPRTATVRAVEETILFVINRKGFEKLLQEHPELSEVIVQELGKHKEELAQRQKQLRDMGLLDATEDDKNPVSWVRKRLKKIFSL